MHCPGFSFPAEPEVGRVVWSEGVATQQVQEHTKIVDTSATVDAPAGPRDGSGLPIRAFQDDGTTEPKTYVPALGCGA